MAAGPGAIGRHILSARRHQPHLKIADRFTRLPGLAQYGVPKWRGRSNLPLPLHLASTCSEAVPVHHPPFIRLPVFG